jgi:serine/threonine protein kinase
MNKEVKLIFEGKEEILDTINSGGEIVELLGLPRENKCTLIGSEIRLTKLLGQGLYGKVFAIEFPGMGEKLYVVKKSQLSLQIYSGTQTKIERYLENELETDWNGVSKWQPEEYIDAWENANHYDKVSVVIPPKMCIIQDEQKYPAIPSNILVTNPITNTSSLKYSNDYLYERITGIIIPKGSYVCTDNAFSELVIAVYTGKLYRDGKCINFFNTYTMFTCLTPPEDEDTDDDEGQLDYPYKRYTQFTFMDKIDGELRKYRSCITWDRYIEENRISPDIVNGVYVQTLFAIAAYQHYCSVSHNDLHSGNVFVEFVTDKTMYNGKYVKDYDYFHYSIDYGGKVRNIYIPAIPLIVKIGDYGLSIKYSKPIVGPLEVFNDGMDTNDGTGAWIPNIFMPQYDNLYFTADCVLSLVKDRMAHNATKLMNDCVEYMCDIKLNVLEPMDYQLINEGYIKPSNARPVLDKLIDVKSAIQVLLNPVSGHYGVKPKGKILTLGKI